jgi:hypothetical protein
MGWAARLVTCAALRKATRLTAALLCVPHRSDSDDAPLQILWSEALAMNSDPIGRIAAKTNLPPNWANQLSSLL